MFNSILKFILGLFLISLSKSQNLTELNAQYKCGIKKLDYEPSGILTEIGAWPWSVALTNEKDNYVASGTIISEYYILTSASAIQPWKALYIFPGLNDFFLFVHAYKINKVITHPSTDLALLELDEPLQFSELIIPICLPNANTTEKVFNANLTLTGW